MVQAPIFHVEMRNLILKLLPCNLSCLDFRNIQLMMSSPDCKAPRCNEVNEGRDYNPAQAMQQKSKHPSPQNSHDAYRKVADAKDAK